MAIALGQPVEEITHGLEGIKIGGHVRFPEKAGNPEVQVRSGLSLPDVVSVQAHHVGHEHPDGEMAARMCPSEASGIEQGNFGPPSGLAHPFVECQGVEQSHLSVEHTAFATEQFPQHLYAGMPQIPFQGPVYTGYPAQIMNLHGYYPYPADGAVYHSPVVDYTHVYNQNCYYSAPGAAPYSIGYSSPYGYPQYHVGPVEHYNVAAATPPLNQDGMMMPEVQLQDPAAFMTYGYQPMSANVANGQWVPMAMVGPPVAGEGVPLAFSVAPHPDSYVPGPIHVQPPAWVPQPEGPKGPSEGDEAKLGLQQPSVQSDSGHDAVQNDCRLELQKIDAKALVVDNKKSVKKQLGFFYGPTMPIKGSWVRSGHLNCMSTTYPLRSLNAKTKTPGVRPLTFEPLSKVEVNSADLSTDFEDAKHFIIKSFSEENVYRSIQYGVWASTANGNKKLDEAFKDSQSRAVGKPKGCPVFLYFSVNGSGRFCGVAEMVGPVDFNNSMDFWERNRWCGSFPVKWHLIKDVPHCQLRRIILLNNENKPVTSSRDTQEVNFEQGLQMLNIIKNYSTKASILDNFPSLPQGLSDGKVEQQPTTENRGEPNRLVDNRGTHQESATTVSESNNALRASNGEAKVREAQPQAKSKADPPNLVPATEIGGRTADKENVMVPNASATVAA